MRKKLLIKVFMTWKCDKVMTALCENQCLGNTESIFNHMFEWWSQKNHPPKFSYKEGIVLFKKLFKLKLIKKTNSEITIYACIATCYLKIMMFKA